MSDFRQFIVELRQPKICVQVEFTLLLPETKNNFMKKITLLVLILVSGSAFAQSFFKDLNVGSDPSNPKAFITNNGKMFFIAKDAGDPFCELWVSDGKESGTNKVKDINPSGGAISPTVTLISNGNYVFFVADDGLYDEEVWRSDGTAAGTIRLSNSSAFEPVLELTLSNGWVFFSSYDLNYGREIWKTNGSAAVRVTDVNASFQDGVPVNTSGSASMVDVNGELYFVGDNGTSGFDVYKISSSTSGASIVKNLNGTNTNVKPENLFAYNNQLLFTFDASGTGEELYVSDGTSAGTNLIDIRPSGSSHPANLTLSQGKVFFDAATDQTGNELYMTDGTFAGTQLVKDINVGSVGLPFIEFKDANNLLYFSIQKGVTGEIWRSDGTASGTYSVINDLYLPSNNTYELFYTSGFMLFTGQNDPNLFVNSLFSINTSNDKVFVLPNTDGNYDCDDPENFGEYNGLVYFSGDDSSIGSELWTLDPGQLSILQSINELSETKLSVFPNPVLNELHINSEFRNSTLSIFNGIGQLVLSKQLEDESIINLENLSPNVYILEVKNNKKIYRTKLIKE